MSSNTSEFLRQHPRIYVEEFPAYAPELNPAEYIWNQTDRALSNTAPQDLEELQALLSNSVAKIGNSQKLLWSCIYASDCRGGEMLLYPLFMRSSIGSPSQV